MIISTEEIASHVNRPVCRTLAGAKEHVAAISLGTRWALCYALDCTLERLHRVLYEANRKHFPTQPTDAVAEQSEGRGVSQYQPGADRRS